MRDESISQAEIDALVRGILGQESSTPAGPAVSQPETSFLHSTFQEVTASAGRTLGDLVGVHCYGTLVDIHDTSMTGMVPSISGSVVIGKTQLVSGLSGTIYYVVPTSLGMAIITQLYGGVAPSAMDESALGALAEGLSQLNQAAMARLAEMMGRPVIANQVDVFTAQSMVEAPGVPLDAPMLVVVFDLAVGETADRVIMALPPEVSSALANVGRARSESRPKPVDMPSMSAAAAQATYGPAKPASAASISSYQPAQFPDLSPHTSPMEGRNIDLLMDVTLQVTVELGRTRRQIRDVLTLGPGSVVELDKLAGEQVDVLVNGKLIAKGEVVVIDENYGVRITDIISASDRAQSLK